MTVTLRVPCEHGKWDEHTNPLSTPGLFFCPGGREPTVEETTQWLKERGFQTIVAPKFVKRLSLPRAGEVGP